MATPRASCWVKTSTAGHCDIDDGPLGQCSDSFGCEGCARHPHMAGAVSFTKVWAALEDVERDYLRRRQEVLRKIGELTERMSADATKVKP